MSNDFLAVAPILYVVFLFSTVCHEAAHALVARWGGDLTAYHEGQVSLDPMPHIRREPVGLVLMPLLMLLSSGGRWTIGWGSAPYNPLWQIRYPRRAAIMALAGPMANFTLACIAFFLIKIGLAAGVFQLTGGAGFVSAAGGGIMDAVAPLLGWLYVLNIILFSFNLLPVPPLDGWTVIGLVVPEDIALKMTEVSRTPGFSLMGMLVAWQVAPIIVRPIVGIAFGMLA